MTDKERILKYLEENAKYSDSDIASALSLDGEHVKQVIAECEADGSIMGYKAIIDWDKTQREYCTAMIEIKVETKTGDGFDAVAKRICRLPEVSALYLMSGDYDLTATIEGKSMKEVAMFVYSKLAAIEGVTGTATHFVLTKYKDKNVIFGVSEEDDREWV